MNILICNAGSTSLKFKLWKMPELTVLAEGRVERVGCSNATFQYASGEYRAIRESLQIPDYATGIRMFLDCLCKEPGAPISSLQEINAIGFKTVLSKNHYGVHELTEEVLEGMRAYMSVAPAHNACYLEAIAVFEDLLPDVRRIGVFETAFHQTIPLQRRIYPVPYEWYEKYGVMKMGYHGASHGYIARKLAGHKRVISCHLGGSGSICAILDGKSMDNSFGFSLQAGIPHSSRTGDVDVYIIPYLQSQGLTMEEIFSGLGKNGGLKGISGTSGDMRDIEAAISEGSERASLAMEYMATSILRYVGAYIVELGGLDAIAFTGGIGENCAALREKILDGLSFMDISVDKAANRERTGERKISKPDSAVEAYVIPANEELIVVEYAYEYCSNEK
ncbi:MAG: acetate/propionate family kinase [Christensenellales bacterium]|nr:acetate/propionate family kinase [Christensenellales bacterium]